MKYIIYLIDFTYTQQGIQSEIMPSAVAGLGTYAEKIHGKKLKFKIFKTPEKLIHELENNPPPHIIAFSHYAWNSRLSLIFSRLIKEKNPNTVVIFGGPHYPIEPDRQKYFLKNTTQIDYFIIKEGEVPFSSLIGHLIKNNFQVLNYKIPSVHMFNKKTKRVYLPEPEERIKDLSEIPSPYLNGWMDEFFAEGMMPIVQTNRGCPFACTFCIEGNLYYNKINLNSFDKTDAELRYIGNKMKPIIENGGRADLFIADSNFGMYKSDIETAKTLRYCQDHFKWPQYVSVATGKNQKERVLEVAKMLRGALRLSGSVQSLSDDVLANIERKNISVDQIINFAQQGANIGANTYSEVILGLPGDSVSKYLDTVRHLTSANFNFVETYTLMLLPGAKMDTIESRKKFGFSTKFRAIPRCFGHYTLYGKEINVGEIEEVVVANNSLNFNEYIECRLTALLIALFYNNGPFQKLLDLLRSLDIPIIDIIIELQKSKHSKVLRDIFDSFLHETKNELWDKEDDLAEFMSKKDNIIKYINGEFGNNVLYRYKSIALISAVDDISNSFLKASLTILKKHDVKLSSLQEEFLKEFTLYLAMRSKYIFNNFEEKLSYDFKFDFEYIIDNKLFEKLDDIYLDLSYKTVVFVHKKNQKETIKRLLNTYGDSITGLTRAVTRTNLKSLMREPKFLRKNVNLAS